MGQGGRGNTATSYLSTYTVSPSPLVRENSIGEFIASGRSMASGDSRSSSCDSSSASSSSAGYIEHPVSRLDTLAGIAIKYGVELGDIKRMNGLVTDLQMFALKTLKIPLPGRHPPTSSNNGFSGKPPRLGKQPKSALAQVLKDSSASKVLGRRPVTSAMGLLQGYYGLSTGAREGVEGTEMSVYKSDSDYHSEDDSFSPFSPQIQDTANGRYSDDGSLDGQGEFLNAYDYQAERHPGAGKGKAISSFEPFPKSNRGTISKLESAGESGGGSEIERTYDRLFRRRAKGENGGLVTDNASEMSIASEIEVNDRVIKVPLGKSSALRQKIPPALDQESDILSRPVVNSSLNGWHRSSDSPGLAGSAVRALSTTLLGGKAVEGFISKIRRSASNPTLQEERRSYKADSSGTLLVSQANIQSGVISSVREGFPKAGAMRRNKAALD